MMNVKSSCFNPLHAFNAVCGSLCFLRKHLGLLAYGAVVTLVTTIFLFGEIDDVVGFLTAGTFLEFITAPKALAANLLNMLGDIAHVGPYLAYFTGSFLENLVITYVGFGLIRAIAQLFKGKKVSLLDNLKLSQADISSVAAWAALSSAVSLVIAGLPSYSYTLPYDITLSTATLLDMAWTVLSFCALPALALGTPSVATALKQSVAIAGKYWVAILVGLILLDFVIPTVLYILTAGSFDKLTRFATAQLDNSQELYALAMSIFSANFIPAILATIQLLTGTVTTVIQTGIYQKATGATVKPLDKDKQPLLTTLVGLAIDLVVMLGFTVGVTALLYLPTMLKLANMASGFGGDAPVEE